jgi:ComF family protein
MPARRSERAGGAVTSWTAAGEYDGAIRQLVHALKYDGRRSLARPIAAIMRARGEAVLEGAAAVVPVPLHWRRRLTRGFNQAADLARHLGPPSVAALRRIRATPTQTGLHRADRRRNVRGAFACTRAAAGLRGRAVVLVDDVSTTGATLEACARALKAAGVREVRALTAGRAVSPRR